MRGWILFLSLSLVGTSCANTSIAFSQLAFAANSTEKNFEREKEVLKPTEREKKFSFAEPVLPKKFGMRLLPGIFFSGGCLRWHARLLPQQSWYILLEKFHTCFWLRQLATLAHKGTYSTQSRVDSEEEEEEEKEEIPRLAFPQQKFLSLSSSFLSYSSTCIDWRSISHALSKHPSSFPPYDKHICFANNHYCAQWTPGTKKTNNVQNQVLL